MSLVMRDPVKAEPFIDDFCSKQKTTLAHTTATSTQKSSPFISTTKDIKITLKPIDIFSSNNILNFNIHLLIFNILIFLLVS